MKNRHSFGTTAMSLGIAFLISGCGEDDTYRWKEDVLLSNGKVITLDRYQEFKGKHDLGQSPSTSDYWFALVDPQSNKEVRFTGNNESTTEALLMSGEKLYLLTSIQGSGWNTPEFKCPDPGFLLWVLEDGTWKNIPFMQIPERVIKANMSPNGFQFKHKDQRARFGGHVPVQMTQARQAERPDRPLIYDFSKVEKQTTGQENCNLERGRSDTPYLQR